MAFALRTLSENVSQEPKAISETVSLLLPNCRYFNGDLRAQRDIYRDVDDSRPIVCWLQGEHRCLCPSKAML
jgi:hypothetical protein